MPFQCPYCQNAFKTSNELTTHKHTHGGEKSFKTSNELTLHKQSHSEEKPFQ